MTPILFNTTSGCGSTNTLTYQFTAVDNFGNESDCFADFIIEDTTPPTIDTPAQDETAVCDGNDNTIELNAWLAGNGGAVASDDCGSVSWENNFTGLFTPDCGDAGSYTVDFIATDDCGNQSTTTATFTITDDVLPTICLLYTSPSPRD